MKKLIATTAAALLAAATVSAGDGLKISGFVRGGISGDLSDNVANAKEDSPIGTTYLLGSHWGASSATRLIINYDGDMGGADFRYQTSINPDADFFDSGNIQFAQAYANFFDGAVMVEGGKLFDKYTTTDGDIGYGFDGVNGDHDAYGLRLVVRPIEGLYVTLAGSSYNPAYYNYYKDVYEGKNVSEKNLRRSGKPKFDGRLLSVSAKYDSEMFAVAGGAHFSGIFYGSFAYKGIENLTLAADAVYDHSSVWSKGKGYYWSGTEWKEEDKDNAAKYYVWSEDDDDATDFFKTSVVLEYSADPVLFGVIGYLYIADDKYFAAGAGAPWISTLNPYLQYKLSDIVTLQAESTLYVPEAWDEKKYGDRKDMYVTVTPAVVFNASKNALVNVWLHVSTDTDQEHHATGVSVKYTF